MSQDRVTELAQKRATLMASFTTSEAALKSAEEKFETDKKALDEVNVELREALNLAPTAAAPAPAPQRGKPGRKPGKGKPGRKPANGSVPTRGLKKVILDLLAKKGGLEAKDIALEVSRLVEKGEYESESENIANNVSQAIHKLKQLRLIRKNEDNKQYQLVNAS